MILDPRSGFNVRTDTREPGGPDGAGQEPDAGHPKGGSGLLTPEQRVGQRRVAAAGIPLSMTSSLFITILYSCVKIKFN